MEHLEKLSNIVGQENCLTDNINQYISEQRNRFASTPLCVLLPTAIEQIQQIVSYCAEHRIGIIPQGGNTGLVGGSVSNVKQILLNLKNLNKIRTIIPENNVIIAEAGCTLQQVKDTANQHNRSFPLGLSIDTQCQIGGNIASNAGGLNTIQYGCMREMTLGIEAVLPDGSLISALHQVRKNNTGFDEKQLFIGTEGTFGIITAASLRLYPKHQKTHTQLIPCNTIQDVLELYEHINQQTTGILAFELIGRFALELVIKHRDFSDPFGKPYPWYVLLETIDPIPVKNALINQAFWKMRTEIPWVQRDEGVSIKHDISIPLNHLDNFLKEAAVVVENLIPNARITPFGHIGDNNIHYNIMQPTDMPAAEFLGFYEECNRQVHTLVLKYQGSISAEHGIGLARQAALKSILPESVQKLHKTLKQAIDPLDIMNPGKGVY